MKVSAEHDRRAVDALEACWNRLCTTVHGLEQAEFDELVQRWPDPDLDPVRLETDLLSPLGKERDEVSHTLALAHLLDPTAAHGLDSELLEAFLEHVRMLAAQENPNGPGLPSFSEDELRRARVLAERAVSLARMPDDALDRVRTDLWLEIPRENPRLIVVIENKVDDVARPGQLEQYDLAVAERLRQLAGVAPPLVIKLYLTPFGDAVPANVVGLGWWADGYDALAWTWRPLLDGPRSAGREFLRLYLATVFQHLCEARWTENPSALMRGNLSHYLRYVLGQD